MENTNESAAVPESTATNEEKQTIVTESSSESVVPAPEMVSEPVTEQTVEEPAIAAETEVAPQATETSMPVTEPEIMAEHDAPLEINEEPIEELEPIENFGSYSKTELTERMEALSLETDVNAIKNKANQAREAFNQIVAHEKATALSAYLEEGNKEEEFEYHPDSLEERFRKAYSKYSKHKADFILGQEKLREENLKTKLEILAQMKNLIQNENNMSKAFNEFHDLQAKWRNTGAVPQQNVRDLWMNYKLYIDRFYDFIKINRELQTLDQKKNLEMKLHLCELAEGLILETSLNRAIQEAQAMQNKWKEIGFVSRELSNELWSRFRTALDKVYENKKQHLEELQKKHAGNFEEKEKLCQQIEVIANGTYEQHNQWQDALKALIELQNTYKKVGPADKVRNEELWKRFRLISDNFFKRKDEYYKKKKQEFAANLQAKTEICIQAEGLQENSDWKTTADELIRLQQEWKKIGQVGSQDRNNKIWARFKAACDVFFNRKKEHFASKDNEHEENLKKKRELIERVEKFELNKDDAAASLEQLKAFQREWSEIGLVPIKQKDKIWDLFRTAIKVHFDALQIRPDFKQGFNNTTDLSRGPVKTNSSDERDITHKMNKLTEEVTQLENNIEFFAKTKSTNLIKQQYEQKIQESKKEIAKLKARLKELKNAN